MTEDHRLYWIWMAEAFRQGSKTAAKLVQRYGSAKAIFEGDAADLKQDSEFTAANIAKIKSILQKPSLKHAGEILSRCDNKGITVLTPEDQEFPSSLKTLQDMPLVLYVYGRLPDCSGRMLTTVVGTRSMSDYGRKVAYSLGAGLAFGGAIVVSGMALGADSMALIGALDAGGTVIAFLGSGVDVIYPDDHKEIYRKIAEHGAVVSEYPPGTPANGYHFPVRNRLMSGIADATVVVEGDAASGAMITARRAIEQGRKLFAVPGKIGDKGAEGTNLLLREGAIPALCAEDVLCEFEFIYSGRISVERAHSSLRGLDLEVLSQNAMARSRIGTGTGSIGAEKNYYGSGSYGGRAPAASRKKAASKASVNPEPEKKEELKTEAEPKKSSGKQSGSTAKKHSQNIITNIVSGFKELKETISDKVEEKSDKKMVPAKKIELDMLDESEIKVYNRMKPDVPMFPDELVDAETTVSDVMSALTMLEMAGAVEAGGGGYFKRVSPDDIMESIND